METIPRLRCNTIFRNILLSDWGWRLYWNTKGGHYEVVD